MSERRGALLARTIGLGQLPALLDDWRTIAEAIAVAVLGPARADRIRPSAYLLGGESIHLLLTCGADLTAAEVARIGNAADRLGLHVTIEGADRTRVEWQEAIQAVLDGWPGPPRPAGFQWVSPAGPEGSGVHLHPGATCEGL